MTDTQIIYVGSPGGPVEVVAPAGWEYDKTGALVWSRLLNLASERMLPQKRKRDEYVIDGQIEILSIILANSIGMAAFYWTQRAKEISRDKE